MTQPLVSNAARQRRSSKRLWLVAVAVPAALAVGAFAWSAPRDDVPLPGPDATPEQVVRAYIDAVNARDFDTANAIDDTSEALGRFSRPMRFDDVEMGKTIGGVGRTQVLFTADFRGGDGTVADGLWGYFLQRGDDGLWRIVDAGVA